MNRRGFLATSLGTVMAGAAAGQAAIAAEPVSEAARAGATLGEIGAALAASAMPADNARAGERRAYYFSLPA